MTTKSLALAKKAHCSPVMIQALEKLGVSEALFSTGDNSGVGNSGGKSLSKPDAAQSTNLTNPIDALNVFTNEAIAERQMLNTEIAAALCLLEE